MPEIDETLRVRAPRERVYELWRDPETFVSIIGGLDEATLDDRRLRWTATGPAGIRMNGEAEITQQRKPEKVAWNTVEGALDAHGSARFTADGDETVVHYTLCYEVPGGAAGQALAEAADVDAHVRRILARFKELAEERAGG